MNPLRSLVQANLVGGAGYNPGATGNRMYGAGGDIAPTRGTVSDRVGYQQRDVLAAARRNALIRRAGGLGG